MTTIEILAATGIIECGIWIVWFVWFYEPPFTKEAEINLSKAEIINLARERIAYPPIRIDDDGQPISQKGLDYLEGKKVYPLIPLSDQQLKLLDAQPATIKKELSSLTNPNLIITLKIIKMKDSNYQRVLTRLKNNG